MTVSSTNNRLTYNGDGVTTNFTTPYFLADTDLKIYVGAVLLTLTTDYSVSGAGVETGGTVSILTPPPVGTGNVVVLREPDLLQQSELPPNDPFPSDTMEKALDKLTMQVQRLHDLIGRTLTLDDADPATSSLILPVTRALMYLAFDSSGNPIAAVDPGGYPASTYMGGLLAETSAAALLAAIGAAASGINGDITKLTGLTTPLSREQGGGGLITKTTLADANATLTAAQLLFGLFTITPTATRTLTTDTAANIIAALARYQAGTFFDFCIENEAAFTVTLAAGSGVTIVGDTKLGKGSGMWRIRIDSGTAITIYAISVDKPLWDFESGSLAIALGGNNSALHGLAEVPDEFEAVLINDTGDAGFVAGEATLAANTASSTGTDPIPFKAWADGSYIGFSAYQQITVSNKTTGAPTAINTAYWHVIVRGRKKR